MSIKPELMIGIAGGTCTGKSTLEGSLQQYFGDDLSIVPLDSFFVPRHELDQLPIDCWDGPDVIRWSDYQTTLSELRSGKSVTMPTFSRESVLAGIVEQTIVPARIVSAGFLALHDEIARSLFDKTIYLDLPEEEIVRRRTERAVPADPWDAPDYIHGNLLAKYRTFVVPQLDHADRIVDGWLDKERLADEVARYILSALI
jgi:uridine kinase